MRQPDLEFAGEPLPSVRYLERFSLPYFIEKLLRGVAAFSTSPEGRFFRPLGEVFGMLTA
jgi:hypothetical protein